jgi:uncharacterized protein (DUF1778 family)
VVQTVKRHRKRASDRRESLVQIRVTADEKKLFESAASAKGMEVSTWLRMLAIEAAKL